LRAEAAKESQLRLDECFSATMTVFVNGRVKSVCAGMSASEIEASILYGKLFIGRKKFPDELLSRGYARF
jgi:hypothetical protein